MFKAVAQALGTGAAIGSALFGAQVASAAVTYTFQTDVAPTSKTVVSGDVTSATYTSGDLSMRVTGWQGFTSSSGYMSVYASTLGLYTGYGIGVTGIAYDQQSPYYSNYGVKNDHQIDNVNGVDFVVLQFSQAVSLTGIGRYVFPLGSGSTYNSDASYWADMTRTLSGTSTTLDLATAMGNTTSSYKYQAGWTDLPGTSTSRNFDTDTSFTSGKTSSVWLVGASLTGQGNDAFKLSSVTVAAVPEPASWAMMIAGFGAVGGAMRRSRRREALRTA